jgi:RNA polymerase sigma-70 factor, ECF subfamily
VPRSAANRRGPARAAPQWLPGSGYYLYHATRADFLRRLGRREEAAEAYRRAIELTENAVEREHLERQMNTL